MLQVPRVEVEGGEENDDGQIGRGMRRRGCGRRRGMGTVVVQDKSRTRDLADFEPTRHARDRGRPEARVTTVTVVTTRMPRGPRNTVTSRKSLLHLDDEHEPYQTHALDVASCLSALGPPFAGSK